MVNVLFVCLGNICRSPIAEGVFRAVVEQAACTDRISVDSAGTSGWNIGQPPDRRAQAVILRHGIDISRQRARAVNDRDFQHFDYLVAMDRSNLAELAARCPRALSHRLHLFLGFGPDLGVSEVPDPYRGGDAAFEQVYNLIIAGAAGLFEHIRRTPPAVDPPAPPGPRRCLRFASMPIERRDPRLVIFDCDGVLVDSEPIAARVLAESAREIGVALTREDCLHRFTGISLRAVLAELERECGQALPADFVERLRERDVAAFHQGLMPVTGVREMLARLTVPRCVASSGTHAKMRTTLGLTGLLPLLEPHLFSATEVPHGKPAPDLFLHAAASMSTLPNDCVVVEDAVPGIHAAVAAGMTALGFTGGGHCGADHASTLLAAGALSTLADMAKLPDLLDDLACGQGTKALCGP